MSATRYGFVVDRTDTAGRIWRSVPFATVDEADAERVRIFKLVHDDGGDGLSYGTVRMVWFDGLYWAEDK